MLLVDDHPIVREGVRTYLTSQQISVVGEASGPTEALCKTRQLSPDVIVLDVSLPSLNGGELAERLHRAAPGARIVAFSIHGSQEYVLDMARHGARGYLTKDQPTSHLAAAILAVHRGDLYFPTDTTVITPAPGTASARTERAIQTLREAEVLSLVSSGQTNRAAAAKLGISVRTVETHRKHLTNKLKIATVAGLTKYALRYGLTK